MYDITLIDNPARVGAGRIRKPKISDAASLNKRVMKIMLGHKVCIFQIKLVKLSGIIILHQLIGMISKFC